MVIRVWVRVTLMRVYDDEGDEYESGVNWIYIYIYIR